MATRTARGASVVEAVPPPADDQIVVEARALFERVRAEMETVLGEVRSQAERRGPHGRRLALLHTKLEEAWLQAKEGAREAHYGQ